VKRGTTHFDGRCPEDLIGLLELGLNSAPLPSSGSGSSHGEVDGYTVIKEIGRGSMGVVYEARQPGTRRRVALKTLRPFAASAADQAELEGRFQREVEFASRLDHPHIGRVLAGSGRGEAPFFVMELIEGEPLDHFVRSRGVDLEQRVGLVAEVCEGVNYAHQRGVIHRDLKPANILVTAEGIPKILDFGLAKAIVEGALDSEAATLYSIDGQVFGTPGCMAPEQARGEVRDLDSRADVYSLGAVLHLLVTGAFPHDVTGSPADAVRRIGAEEPVLRHTDFSGHRLPADLRAILAKATAFRREDRYNSAGALAADLHRFREGNPVEARPLTLWYSLAKHARKHWAGYAAGGAAVVLAGGLTAAWLVQTRAFAQEQARLRAVAESERLTANRAASNASYRLSRRHAVEGDVNRSLAHLAAAVRLDPDNRSARAAAAMALLHDQSLREQFRLRLPEPMKAEFSRDGKWILVAGQEVAQIRSVRAPERVVRQIALEGQPFALGWACTPEPTAMVLDQSPEAGEGDGFRLHRFGLDWETAPRRWSGAYPGFLILADFEPAVAVTREEGERHYLSVWDLGERGALRSRFENHDLGRGDEKRFARTQPRFHPNGRGFLCQPTGPRNENVWFFDLETRAYSDSGMTVSETRCYHDHHAVSPSKTLFAGSGQGGRVSVWKLEGPELVHHFNHGAKGGHPVQSVCFTPDERFVAGGVRCGHAVVFDLETGEEAAALSHDHYVLEVAFGHEGRLLLTRTDSGEAYLWNWRAGERIADPVRHGSNRIDAIRMAPASGQLLTVTKGEAEGLGELRLWSTTPRRIQPEVVDQGAAVHRAVFTPDGRRLLSYLKPLREVRILPGNDPGGEVATLSHRPSHTVSFGHFHPAINRRGTHLLVAESERSLALYRLDDLSEPVTRVENRHTICGVALDPDGRHIATGDVQNHLAIWKVKPEHASEIRRYTAVPRPPDQPDHDSPASNRVHLLHFSPDGTQVVAANFPQVDVLWWDWRNSLREPFGHVQHYDTIHSVRFSEDSQWIGSATLHLRVRAFAVRDDSRHGRGFHGASVRRVRFVPGQPRLLSASYDKTAQLWEYGGSKLHPIGPPFRHEGGVAQLEVSGDGFLAVTATREGEVHLWDLHHGEGFAEPFSHDGNPVYEVGFHPSEPLLLTAGRDGKIRLWPIALGRSAAPGWFPDLLEAIGGLHVGAGNTMERLPENEVDDRLHRIRERLDQGDLPRGEYERAAAQYLGVATREREIF